MNILYKEYTTQYTNYPWSVITFSDANNIGGVKNVNPTQKPVAMLEYLIRTYIKEGDTVLDNCMGSGSTGVACVHTGRSLIGMELNDHYFAGARRRIAGAGK